MSDSSRKTKAEHILNLINTGINRNNEKLFKSYKKKILSMLDKIDSSKFDYTKSVYNIVDGCNRDEISNYISTSNKDSIAGCIGEMQSHISEL